MKEINPGSLSKLLARTTYTSVVGVKPTGWTHTKDTDLAGMLEEGVSIGDFHTFLQVLM